MTQPRPDETTRQACCHTPFSGLRPLGRLLTTQTSLGYLVREVLFQRAEEKLEAIEFQEGRREVSEIGSRRTTEKVDGKMVFGNTVNTNNDQETKSSIRC